MGDHIDEKGNPDVFTGLKIGEDVDLWSFDATNEPYSGGRWCAQTGACNSFGALYDRYKDWDLKGGAFCVIDAARFFNLNTAATGGRPGYKTGGIVDFGDYTLAIAGFPYLTDSYWSQMLMQESHTTDGIANNKRPDHKFSEYLIQANTTLKTDIVFGTTTIELEDAARWKTTGGYGAIVCEKGDSRDSEDLIYYYKYGARSATSDTLTSAAIVSIPNGPQIEAFALPDLIDAEIVV